MELRDLILLRELDERGSLTAVARATQVTPSAVSQRIRSLERTIGLPLTDYTVSVADGRWSGQAVMPRSYLAEPVQSFNAYRIHGVAGSGTGRHYLAHAAPGGSKPDFHRLDAFVAVPTPEASGP